MFRQPSPWRSVRFRKVVTWVHLLVIFLGVIAVYGCKETTKSSVRDTSVPFSISHSDPFQILLSRGGWEGGMYSISIKSDGEVTLERANTNQPVRATLQLLEMEMLSIVHSLNANGILQLDREYHDTRVADGTQWICILSKGHETKKIYCNNHFPPSLIAFARDLDSVVESEQFVVNWGALGIARPRGGDAGGRDLGESPAVRE